MSDILIDLGEMWNHIIPLSSLASISHISVSDGQFIIECTIQTDKESRIVEYKSAKRFNDKELATEKNRLLGFSNGIIGKDDMKAIIKTMETQTGKKLKETLDQPVYDMHYVRRVWATLHDEPYYRFILQYDPVEDTVKAVEESNDAFAGILGDWLDDHTMQVVTKLEDRLLLFAFETIDRMADPIKTLTDRDEFVDPNADIPVMGDATQGRAAQQVDLSQPQAVNPTLDSNVMMRT